MPETAKAFQELVDLTIAAPIDAVWAALRDPAQIGQWFGWDAPSLDEEIDFIFVNGATPDEGNRLLQFGAWEGASDAIQLTQEAGGTRLQLLRSGGRIVDWATTYDDVAEGWVNFFQQLRLALEQHPGAIRRTLYLSGLAGPGTGEPSAELGLGAAAAMAPGATYAAPLATDDSISGQVWYQTHFQTGLTVEQWGNGLLVVTDMGVSPKRPHGGGSVLLTTYGLSNADFSALEARWKAWWGARYNAPTG